jgi:hypothetical protein
MGAYESFLQAHGVPACAQSSARQRAMEAERGDFEAG